MENYSEYRTENFLATREPNALPQQQSFRSAIRIQI